MTMKFEDSAKAMLSDDYKERFKAEYIQTKTRYEKLKAFNTKIEAAFGSKCNPDGKDFGLKEPNHDCPSDLLREQQRIMGEYLHILELRAVFEKIEL